MGAGPFSVRPSSFRSRHVVKNLPSVRDALQYESTTTTAVLTSIAVRIDGVEIYAHIEKAAKYPAVGGLIFVLELSSSFNSRISLFEASCVPCE
jgi:hypothetical protein